MTCYPYKDFYRGTFTRVYDIGQRRYIIIEEMYTDIEYAIRADVIVLQEVH